MKALDLFCGGGGATRGLAELGFRVSGIDADANAVETNIHNGFAAVQADLKRVSLTGEAPLLIWGSPPCQPFSQGNVRGYGGEGESDPRDCVGDFIRHLKQVNPEMFVFENVPGINYSKHQHYLDMRLKQLSKLGYHLRWGMLRADNYGVPQRRRRFFILGAKSFRPSFPEQKKAATMAQALRWNKKTAQKRSINNDDVSWVFERPAMTVVGSFQPEIMAGPGYRKAGDGPRQKTPGSVRITEAEGALLQGFPPHHVFTGPKSVRWRLIGDAVPVSLAKAVAKRMVEQHEGR